MQKLTYEKYTVKEKKTYTDPFGNVTTWYEDVVKRRNPKLSDVVSIYSHGKSCIAHYQNGKKIWPEDESLKNSIVVELPEVGSLEWAYWVHALARVAERGYTEDNYVRIKIGEEYYYVGAAPAGQKALKVKGGQFYYADGRAMPKVTVGEDLQIEANVRESVPFVKVAPDKSDFTFLLNENRYDIDCKTREEAKAEGWIFWNDRDYYRPLIKDYTIADLPLLPEDIFHVRASKYKAEKNGTASILIYSMPSNTMIAEISVFVCGGERSSKRVTSAFSERGFFKIINNGWGRWVPQTDGQIVDGDTYWRARMFFDYNKGSNECALRFRRDTKGFSRTWQMPVTLTT